MSARLSVTDLYNAGVVPSSGQAVALVRDLVDRVRSGALPGIPSATVLRFSGDGLTIEGPVDAGGRAVPLAAQLLEALLGGAERPHELRVPGALRIVIARATGLLDLPPFPTLERFDEALARFGAPGSADDIARALADAWSAAEAAPPIAGETSGQERPATPATAALVPTRSSNALAVFPDPQTDLTISDIRRARRATGVPLADVAVTSGVPLKRLRELEWGDLRSWPPGTRGRELILRYARAAGLDEHVVARVAWPLLAEQGGRFSPPLVLDLPICAAPPDVPASSELPVFRVTPARRAARSIRVAAAVLTLASAATLGTWVTTTRVERPTRTAVAPRSVTPDTTPAGDDRAAAARAVPSPSVPAARPPVRRTPALAPGSRSAARPAAGLPDSPAAYSPAFATAGSAMFYHAKSSDRSALMRADTDGHGSILQITSVVRDRGQNFHARPSPDGRTIAFDSDRDGERGVYVAEIDGRHVRRVSGNGFAAIPSWSPNGKMLAIVRAEPGRPRVWNLWTVELATHRMRRLTSYAFGQPWGGSWFPDGRRLAYSHEARLYVLDLKTGQSRAYETPVKGRLVRTPAVSPNGNRIIFQVYRDGAWMLNLADGSMRKVLSDPYAEEYAWSPDGRRVAFHSRRSGGWGIWVMAAE